MFVDALLARGHAYKALILGEGTYWRDDPNPVVFISALGTYLVAVQGPNAAWTDFAVALLTRALAEHGVGGKTSSGYGRLTPVATGPSAGVSAGAGPARPAFSAGTEPLRKVSALKPQDVKGQLHGLGEQWMRLPEDTPEIAEIAKKITRPSRGRRVSRRVARTRLGEKAVEWMQPHQSRRVNE